MVEFFAQNEIIFFTIENKNFKQMEINNIYIKIKMLFLSLKSNFGMT